MPKWTPHARRGQFLGYSKAHSSTVGLILNPRTGNISPQYHLVHDDLFATVPNAEGGVGFDLFQFNQTTWNRLVDVGHERHLDDTANPPSLSDEWLSDAEQQARDAKRQRDVFRENERRPWSQNTPQAPQAPQPVNQREPSPQTSSLHSLQPPSRQPFLVL